MNKKYDDHERKVQLLLKNVLFSSLELPHSIERRVQRLIQRIRLRSGAQHTSQLDVLYLALDNGLMQMECLERSIGEVFGTNPTGITNESTL